MSKFDINATPFTVYTPDDGGVPGEGLNASERALFRTEMEVPSLTELSAVETKADNAQIDANQAISDAASAQSTADAACPDSDAIKTSGNQEKFGLLTFNGTFPKIYYPSSKTYDSDEFVRHADIEAMISAANPDPSWSTLTLVNGWSGSAKYRVIGDYLEIWFSVGDSSATSIIFATIPGASAMNYTVSVQHTNPSVSFFFNSNGNLAIVGYDGISTYTQYQKFIRLSP